MEFYNSHISPPDEVCRRFSLSEIHFATQHFDDRLVIGRGSFGKVYKCTIYHQFETIVVAMKRLNLLSSQGAPEFWAEVEMLGKLHHCNLVSLIGYCNEKQEMVLVYEYMKHGTLEYQLHRAEDSPSWLQRLRICIDAAHGLNYLHTGTNTQHGVIHRDVKTSNILLDENFRAKISDFGLAKISPTNQAHSCVSTQVKGTFGYIDPSYFYTGKLTRKSDVYAFGIVLLEVLCGRPAVDATLDEEQWGLAAWALEFIRKGKQSQIVDHRIGGRISPNCLKEFTRMTISCLHDNPKFRPTMVEVVAKLGSILSLQERMDSFNSNTTFIQRVRSLFACKGYMKFKSWMLVDEAGSDSESSVEDIELLNSPVHVDIDNWKEEQEASVPLICFDATCSFTMADLLRAPAENISRTSYSSIYQVMLDDGHHLVVKRLIKKFFNKLVETQVFIHGKVRHKNIMPLQACYNHKSEALLIYASSENGTLASFLNAARRPKTAIGWPTRKKIIVGITRGLVHLHTMEHMIHGNLTSTNVLLDKDCKPFIIDIGLSRFRMNARPDSGYNHAPELLYFENASMETDVYGLGFIIFELLTRKSTYSVKHGSNMLNWVRSLPKEQWTRDLFDAEIMFEAISNAKLLCILQLAMNCTCISPVDRPKADEVLQRLEEISATRKGRIRRRNARKCKEKEIKVEKEYEKNKEA